MTNLKFPLTGKYIRVRGFAAHKASHPGSWYGIDFGCKVGTKVVSTRSGAVNKVAYDKFSGNNIIIQHRNSKGQLVNLYSWYAHLSKVYIIAHQKVKTCQTIGSSGATGTVTGPHLHWSILRYQGIWPFRRLVPLDPENKKTFTVSKC